MYLGSSKITTVAKNNKKVSYVINTLIILKKYKILYCRYNSILNKSNKIVYSIKVMYIP